MTKNPSLPVDKDQSQQSNSSGLRREWMHGSVLASVSYDLKMPLASIIGSLEIYERMKDKIKLDKSNILINTALQEAYRLDGFITNILDLARLESGDIRLKKELCVMDLLLEDCLILLGHRLRECIVTIKPASQPLSFTTDPLLLMRAICIILDNTAKHAGDRPTVSIEYERVKEQVIIHIHDDGPGIPESRLEEIFSEHTRFAIQNKPRTGTGLGLSICRKIMNLLDGSVTVANLGNGKASGVVFTLTFPA